MNNLLEICRIGSLQMKVAVPFCLFILILAIGCSNHSSPIIVEEEIHYVDNLVAGLSRAMNKRDTSDLSLLVSDSVKLMPPDKISTVGLESFKNFILNNQWEQFQILEPQIEFRGNISLVNSRFSYSINQEKPNNPLKFRGDLLLLVSKSEDGLWRLDRFVYSSWRRRNQNATERN